MTSSFICSFKSFNELNFFSALKNSANSIYKRFPYKLLLSLFNKCVSKMVLPPPIVGLLPKLEIEGISIGNSLLLYSTKQEVYNNMILMSI